MKELRNNDYDNEKNGTEAPVTDKIGFWQQIAYAITKAGKYIDMVQLRTGKSVKYVLLLMLLVSIMVYAVPTAATIAAFGGFQNLFLNKIPSFRMEAGELKSEEPFDIDISGIHFYVDTDADMIPNNVFEDNSVYIAIGSKTARVVFTEADFVSEFNRFRLSDVFPEGFDNKGLAQLSPYLYLSLVLNFVMVIIQYLVKYSFLALIYMILAWAINKTTGLMLTKKQVFMLCMYAQTLGILLVNINAAFGYILPPLLMSIIGVFATSQYISAAFYPYLRNKFEN